MDTTVSLCGSTHRAHVQNAHMLLRHYDRIACVLFKTNQSRFKLLILLGNNLKLILHQITSGPIFNKQLVRYYLERYSIFCS
jgi:hypothetical protein